MKVAMGMTCSASIRVNLSRLHMKSAVLFMEHCKEIAAAESTLPWPQPHLSDSQSYASATVILAVAALEASTNELYLDAVDGNSYRISAIPVNKRVLLAKWWKEHKENTSIIEKCNAVLKICDKSTFCEGAEPFNSAQAVVRLRNAMTHFKPEWDDALQKHKKLQELLKGKFAECALALQAQGHMVWFPDKCLGAGCAEWAVKTIKDFDAAFSNTIEIPSKFSKIDLEQKAD